MNKRIFSLLILPFFLLSLFLFTKTTHAFSLGDVVNGVKSLISPAKKELKIDSSITLVPEGDVNKNGQIDAGDTVRFTYTLTNTTDREYSFATLKTNINRKQLNFIHNITGTASLDDDGKTIEIPNFRIAPNQIAAITFDARVNYYTSEDPTIATVPEFFDNNNRSIVKSLKKEIKAIRINKDKIPGMIKMQIKK
ncbi:hypothetical protein KJ980_07210 [Patescibacteria group bacterium]|nr:hypothetical protein [Patescibacteria group bacterium]MBU4016968.1 hypothetical protein [Patescibacteria group bacterium]MBU4099409.1 hypothetical protein [Patescibacteria group bacterium]